MNLPQRAQSRRDLELAAAAIATGRAGDALSHAQAAIEADPGNIDARMIEAEAHLLLNDTTGALRSLDAVSYYEPSSNVRPGFALLRARALIAAGKDVAAHAQLVELVREYSHDARPRRMLAGVCLKLEDRDSAIGQLREVLRLEPGDAATRRLLAELVSDTDPDEALRLIEPLVRVEPDLVTRWRMMRWLSQAGRIADAEELCRELVGESGIKPRDAGSGRPRPADHTDDALVLLEAGRLAERQGAVEVARRRLLRAIEQDGQTPQRCLAMMSLAVTLLRAGEWVPAAWWAWKVVRQDAQDTDAWAVLAVAALQQKRHRLARLTKARLARWTAGEQRRALSRAWLNASAGVVIERASEEGETAAVSPLRSLLNEAAATFRHHAATRQHWADTHYHLAVCDAALGDFDAAHISVQAALDINPHYRAATQLAASLPKAA